jgi:folate-binding protein YgfZ
MLPALRTAALAAFAFPALRHHVRIAMGASIPDQVAAARRAALAVEEGDLQVWRITGADRLSWLNGMLTCDLANAKPGDAVYGLAVSQKGRILSDLFVIVESERALVLVRRAVAASLAVDFERHLMMEDAELAPEVEAFSVLGIHGPRSAALLDAARAAGASGGLVDVIGLGGAVLASPRDRRDDVRRAIDAALAREGGVFGDDAGWEALRVERAVPRFGVDFDETTYPQEAGLEASAVSFSKGCYLGQEVVCMLQMRGHVKRKLAQLVFSEGVAPMPGAHVFDGEGGPDVGRVTSAASSPTLGKPVALAMLKLGLVESGRSVRVDGRPARVA